jgi:hypothetical protein
VSEAGEHRVLFFVSVVSVKNSVPMRLEWQAAMQALLLVAEHDGPAMFARIGVMRALNRHVGHVFDPSRKDHHWGRPKLARDR